MESTSYSDGDIFGDYAELNHYRRPNIVLLLLVVLASVIIDVARTTITSSASGIEKDIEVAKVTGVGPEQFNLRWSNLLRMIYWYVGRSI